MSLLTGLQIQRLISPFPPLIGLLALTGGAYGILNPTAFSSTLGIRASPRSPALPFVSFVGARNLSSGLSLLLLTYYGERRAVGIVLMSGTAAAFVDAWVCVSYGAEESKAMGHAVMSTLVGVGHAVMGALVGVVGGLIVYG